ncbi:uncharacterized protein PSFLO_00345 [Pseudozyma flocculosa]|uniref:Alpha/beta hydrolase fold-3 domain-containing protein n=1 Tax=Pseudozyma flocculosa TaxID=84751 RepID=A0A5C3ERB0_9BASI|nr:uncharacterized protein PSFLO_00345 [Pseudozyma flocculosa]
MTITTLGTAAHISPTVIRTVFNHFYAKLKKAKEDRHIEATDELLFDEAFNIVRSFIELATHDTVESLQRFANTHVPAAPWAISIPTMVPMESCNQAAEILKQYFGPKDLKDLIGGEKWWQIRSIPGVQAEWIAQTSDWKKASKMESDKGNPASTAHKRNKRNARHEKSRSFTSRMSGSANAAASEAAAAPDSDDSDDDGARRSSKKEVPRSEEMDRLQRTCLYLHGGGYYFGSMSTHRYQVVRFARKFGGRCFAPIYRKAPQYPWPAPLLDCLASYLFLIRPPPGAKHKAIDPSKLVIAGDSAGGGLSLALLTILRDMDLPMPAGAVLISPWCDMTHSFPSILQNTATDIPGIETDEGPDSPERKVPIGVEGDGPDTTKSRRRSRSSQRRRSLSAARKSEDAGDMTTSKNPREQAVKGASGDRSYVNGVPPPPKLLYSEPIEVRTEDPDKANIQLRSQIQLYATNAQLTHPLCSPILHGSLGGLPPLYIIAGNAEVLRDEIIYLAHRAANPRRYPLRADLLERSERARQNAARFDDQPTKVHLQVYDDMCHVLTLFAFTTQSRFAYRAIASFIKHVTGAPTNVKEPFPDVAEGDFGPEDTSQRSGSEVLSPYPTASSSGAGAYVASPEHSANNSTQASRQASQTIFPALSRGLTPIDTSVAHANGLQNGTIDSPYRSASRDAPLTGTTTNGSNPASAAADKPAMLSVDSPLTATSEAIVREQKRRASSIGVGNEYTGQVPLTRPSFQSYMIRERVNVKGFLRPLEPESELQALRMDANEVGRIKEGPCQRYLSGQELWSKKFEKTARKVEKQRAKNEETAQKLLERAASLGLLKPSRHELDQGVLESDEGVWSGLGALGPLELVDETPPPSALAGRRDTEEALNLLRTMLYVRAEQRGVKKSKLKIRSAPRHSNAEKPAEGRTRYGLKLWNKLMVRGGLQASDRRKREREGLPDVSVADDHGYVDNLRQTNLRRSMSERRPDGGNHGGWATQDEEEGEGAALAAPSGSAGGGGETERASTAAA